MIIDLRSDTVTQPTQGMMDAMLSAPLGDDVFGEDPTVNKLEEKLAEMFGMEAGLFCPSGTMTNQIAIKAHTQPGDEVICDINSHIYVNEGGGIAFNSGVQARVVNGNHGKLTAAMVEENINPMHDWLPHTALVSLENTVNKAGGSFYTAKEIESIKKLCSEKNLPLHLDGARIFNALEETKESTEQVGKLFDSISICLSKGLGTPLGSVLIGKKEFIKRSKRIRKVFGGGMRQAGIIAAAGLYALDHHIKRLADDHRRAKEIEKALKAVSLVEEILPVETNIVIFNMSDKITGAEFIKKLAGHNIKASGFGKQSVRMVTHLDFKDEMLEKVIATLHKMQ